MPSDRFTQLSAQLDVLREHLLPAEFTDTGQYGDSQDRVETSALAYRVLCHAEIETYFEDRSLEAMSRAREAWDASRFVSHITLCLLAFSGKEMKAPPDSLEAPSDNLKRSWPALLDIGEKLVPAMTEFYKLVRKDNHGIKEKNLLALLLPIGIDHKQLDPIFLTEIDQYGSLRGMAAHTSSRSAVRQAVDPAEESRRIDNLLPGIAAIDGLVEALLADIPASAAGKP